MKDVNTSDLEGLLETVSIRTDMAIAEAERFAVGPSLVALVEAVRDQQLMITALRELVSRLDAPKSTASELYVDTTPLSATDAKAALDAIKEEMVIEVIEAITAETPVVADTKASEDKAPEVKVEEPKVKKPAAPTKPAK